MAVMQMQRISICALKENRKAILEKLQALGILKETTNAARNRVFSYEEYLQILRQGT